MITANKGPVAFAYRRLAQAAERADRRFLFEGAVMDGVPIFNLVRETLPPVQILGFRGVVNSTTNFILTAMEQGQRFEDALAEMQARGIAEADASLDIDGWDAAAKTAALANVLLGANITPQDVIRVVSGRTRASGDRSATAGRRLKLVARAQRAGSAVAAGRGPRSCPATTCSRGWRGSRTRSSSRPTCSRRSRSCQRGGSLTQTAYALLFAISLTVAGG